LSRCVIALKASRDLNDISDYFAIRNIEAGERLLQDFERKCVKLMQFPQMGKSYAAVRPLLRGIPLDGYIIFYEVTDDGITILRVVSGRQNLDTLFDEDPEN
jgi:toxin ParE1/3/4